MTTPMFTSAAPTVTLHDVALCKVGTWNSLSGPSTITHDDLQAMLDATGDPDVDDAPLVVGHRDPRFRELTDGEPAIGWVVPRRIDGDVLVGDLTDVPVKMAAIIPKAFRRRSAEVRYGVTTPAGMRHKAVLTGLALLGAKAPAVKGLDDVLARYSATAPAAERVTEYLWGPEVLDDLDEEVLSDTPDTSEPSAVATLSPAHDQHEPGETPGGTVPRFTDEALRRILGLPQDFDMTAVQTALGSEGDAALSETPTPAPAPAETVKVTEQPVAEQTSPEGVVMLSAGALAELQEQARAGAAASQELATQRKQRKIDMALAEGRISPAEQAVFRQRLDVDEEGTTILLSALTPNVKVPIQPVGSAEGRDTDVVLSEQEQADWSNFFATFANAPVEG